MGFAYSLELLVKAEETDIKLSNYLTVAEREIGQEFKIFRWLKQYLNGIFMDYLRILS